MHLTSLKNIILNLFPILIFFLTAIPVRVFGINYSSSTLNLTVNIIMYICVPIYLVILNYHQTQKNIFSFVIIYLFLLMMLILFLAATHIIGAWAMGTNFLRPTGLSLALIKLVSKCCVSILTVSWIIACVIKWIRVKN